MKALLTDTVQLIDDWLRTGSDGAEEYRSVPGLIAAATPTTAAVTPVPAVVRHCLDRIPAAAAERFTLIGRLCDAAARLSWLQLAPSYAGEAFTNGFAFTMLAGARRDGWPEPQFICEGAAVGFAIQGPDVDYAPHWHKALEVYFVLSGAAQWRRGSEDWVTRAPGEVIYHSSDMVHAMRTGSEPLLAVWAWTGDIAELPQVDRSANVGILMNATG